MKTLPLALPFSICASIALLSNVASALTVNTLEDQFDTPSGPELSIREAVRDAGTGAATIDFDASLSGKTITLYSGELLLQGNGTQGKITIDGSSLEVPITFAGNGSRIVFWNLYRDLRLKGLVIQNGMTPSPALGAVSCTGAHLELMNVKVRNNTGTAVYVTASVGKTAVLTAVDSEFYENHSLSISNAKAGAIFVGSTGGDCSAVIERCAIYHNSSGVAAAVGVTAATLTMRNCTIAENVGDSIILTLGGAATDAAIKNCTVVDNLGYGVVRGNGTQLDLKESIVARNRLADGTLSSFNLGVTSLGGNLTDQVLLGATSLNQSFDQTGVDPKLSSLGYNGGEVLSCYPLVGSPAIDGGDPNRRAGDPSDDTRGFTRVASALLNARDNIIDIGAVEIRTDETLTVINNRDSGRGSLREAVGAAAGLFGSEGQRIVFDPSLDGQTITLASSIDLVRISGFERHTDIDASNLPSGITLKVNSADTQGDDIFYMNKGRGLSLHGVKFDSFRATGKFNPIRIEDSASIGLDCVTFRDNSSFEGGAFNSSSSGRSHFTGCSFSENKIRFGSALSGSSIIVPAATEGGLVQVWKSSFFENTSNNLFSSAHGTVVLLGNASRLEVRNSTFHKNESYDSGSCIYIDGGAGVIQFSTFSDGEASGGAISLVNSSGSVDVTDCLFLRNRSTLTGHSKNDYKLGVSSSLGRVERNWTDNIDNSLGFFPAPSNTAGAVISMAPFAIYTGKGPVLPALSSSESIDGGSAEVLRARDAQGNLGTRNGVPDPGAVEGGVSPTGVLSILSSEIVSGGSEMKVGFVAPAGTHWRVDVSEDLQTFTLKIADIEATGVSEFRTFTLPVIVPDDYFFRFVALP